MKSKQNMYARTETVTVSVRPATPRLGNTYTYVLNGTLMRDVLVDGKWITLHAGNPLESRAAQAATFLSVEQPMQNLLMLLMAAGSSSLCACTTQPQANVARPRPVIVVQKPRGEPGDFTICADGRVLVYPASHPKSCS
ncbi:hypothetical protein [Paraburkholderia sp. RL17-337-BIB-A]|uniref:hypothetical protein n=1 Tax=Paraburkholderia sp. RL17-337-BIB-A TaxID=3031636 RepID=UPI0038BD0739